MAASFDAIVIGGGHNGLVAAAYLARSGARTLVLEGRDTTGGAATTEAPWPDAPEFRVTRLSYVMGVMPPTIISDLDLPRHGYKVYPMGPYYQAFPEGGSIKLYADDARRNHDEVSKWSRKDADAMPRWDAWLEGWPTCSARCCSPSRPSSAPAGPATSPKPSAWPGASAASRADGRPT
jgi:phytoene dehydrogenase-like protein